MALHEVLPQILWTRYFLEAQGYGVDDSIVYQDNQSAILLTKNGRGSSSKRTCHINIRYFFVADQIANKEVKVEYCPTGDMIADYFTKPLQGSLFKRFRDFIMNADPSPNLRPTHNDTYNSVTDRRSVLESSDDVRSSNGPTKVSAYATLLMTPAEKHGSEQTEHAWSVIDHKRGRARRHRTIQREIERARRAR